MANKFPSYSARVMAGRALHAVLNRPEVLAMLNEELGGALEKLPPACEGHLTPDALAEAKAGLIALECFSLDEELVCLNPYFRNNAGDPGESKVVKRSDSYPGER